MLPIECGLFGICCQGDANSILKQSLNSLQKLQHRGQDSFGISYHNKNKDLIVNKYVGVVSDNINNCIEENKDNILSISYPKYGYHNIVNMIGHLRYKTSGKVTDNEYENIQPFLNTSKNYSIAHNGNIKNTELLHHTLMELKPKLEESDIQKLKERNHDTFYILQILEHLPAETIEDKLIQFINIVPGVYCLLILIDDNIFVVRDRFGVRPLSLATIKVNDELNYMVASESVAYPKGSVLVRDVKPGEIMKISIKAGFETIYQLNGIPPRHCLFEYIYFLRPETESDGLKTAEVRRNYGGLLSNKELKMYQSHIDINQYPIVDEEHNICIIKPIDYQNKQNYIVVGSPSSGIVSAEGYANNMELKYEQIIIKQKNIRSFILNNDAARRKACYQKFKFIEADIKDKNIILVDDSLVRGNTIRIMVQILKELGAIEVHVRIASPPIKHPCYFGIDIPDPKELIANNHNLYSLTCIVGADSLVYLDLDDIKNVHNDTICHACFSGKYQPELLEW